MPDTYISQFSGEEIDSALRAAQIISGASTLAELRDKLEIRGDTIPVSAEDSTLISDALTKIPTTSGGGVNPNLLDNWYFGNPVNQRGKTEYTSNGYTIDRWKFNNNNGDLVIDDTGIMFIGKQNYAEFEQRYEFPKDISGKQITISILADSFSGEGDFYLVIQNQTNYRTFLLSAGLNSFTLNFFDESSVFRYFIQSQNVNETNPPKMHLLAAKLELGSTQTLAHKEGDKWVLNEIPDFGEQLRRCQRYYRRWTGADNKPLGVAVRRESKLLELVFSLDTAMRVSPSLTFNGSFVCIPTFTWCSVTSIDVATPDTVAVFLKPNDDVTFDLDAYQINIAHANEYIALSADL
jgi:hypothetical protein